MKKEADSPLLVAARAGAASGQGRPTSIHQFRTHQYRVFLAEPYFKLDLHKEVRWHEDHLKKLRLQANNPALFHRARTSHEIEEHHHRHFKEHVLDSIPFHEEILSQHRQRLDTVLGIMPERKYRKIRDVSMRLDTVADYFVFDRLNRGFFFVVDRPSDDKRRWSKVIERKRLSEVLFLE